MKRFIEGVDRSQSTLFPEKLKDFIAEDNPVRVVDVFVEQLNLRELGFKGIDPSPFKVACHFLISLAVETCGRFES